MKMKFIIAIYLFSSFRYGSGPDNLEVTPRGDRNQYLETGQLADQDTPLAESAVETDAAESLPPPGLSRLVTGAGHNIDMHSETLTPPPGLDREVLGRLTDAETQVISIGPHGKLSSVAK